MKRISTILLLSFLILASVFCARSGAQEGGTTPNVGLTLPGRNQGLTQTLTYDLQLIDLLFSYSVPITWASTMTVWTSSSNNYVPLAGNCTIAFPSSPFAAGPSLLYIGQSGIDGPFTVSWGTPITWIGSSTIPSAAGALSKIICNYNSNSGWTCQQH